MRKITGKLVICAIAVVLLIQGVFGAMNIYMSLDKSEKNAEYTVSQSAVNISGYISSRLNEVISVAYETGCNINFTSFGVGDTQKNDYLRQKCERYGFIHIELVDDDGTSVLGDGDFSSEAGFAVAMKGETYISQPEALDTGELVINFYAPLWSRGVDDSITEGVIRITCSATILSEVISSAGIAADTQTYIIDNQGYIIADTQKSSVTEKISYEELAVTDQSLSAVAEANTKVRSGENGFIQGFYPVLGKDCYIGYSPIANSGGWSVVTAVPMDELLGAAYNTIYLETAGLIVGLIVAVALAIMNGSKIGKAVAVCSERLRALAAGDVTAPVVVVKSKDETAEFARSVFITVESVKSLVNDLKKITNQMSEGNFNHDADDIERSYTGSFAELINDTQKLCENLSDKLSGINDSASVVCGSANRVSGGAQTFSDSTATQHNAVRELSGSVGNMTAMLSGTADNCADMKEMTNRVNSGLSAATDQMKRLTASMDRINTASEQIEEIVKTIEDISFQTNILALNAAVEAAKAGEAGRGFAVVADEVRSLAERSSEAAKITTRLVKDTVVAVRDGGRVAGLTSRSVDEAAEAAMSVISDMDKVARESEEQVQTVKQIAVCVEQISAIIRSNTVISEENIASGKELAEQAQRLRELVGSFTYRMK